jgi:uncharacterized membrane protein
MVTVVPAFYIPVFIPAFLIVVLEMTEVVALVFAIGADSATLRHPVLGALAGTAVVAAIGLAAGAALRAVPADFLLAPAAVVLAGFGVFLFRSTLRSYRRAAAAAAPDGNSSPPPHRTLQFAGGFSVGAIETTEAVIVLLALAAPRPAYAFTALVGAVVGGLVLVGVAVVLHDRIRRIKVPGLKTAATSLLFTFAMFWGGEAVGIRWPGGDLFLVPIFAIAILAVRAAVGLLVPARAGVPVRANP